MGDARGAAFAQLKDDDGPLVLRVLVESRGRARTDDLAREALRRFPGEPGVACGAVLLVRWTSQTIRLLLQILEAQVTGPLIELVRWEDATSWSRPQALSRCSTRGRMHGPEASRFQRRWRRSRPNPRARSWSGSLTVASSAGSRRAR